MDEFIQPLDKIEIEKKKRKEKNCIRVFVECHI